MKSRRPVLYASTWRSLPNYRWNGGGTNESRLRLALLQTANIVIASLLTRKGVIPEDFGSFNLWIRGICNGCATQTAGSESQGK